MERSELFMLKNHKTVSKEKLEQKKEHGNENRGYYQLSPWSWVEAREQKLDLKLI